MDEKKVKTVLEILQEMLNYQMKMNEGLAGIMRAFDIQIAKNAKAIEELQVKDKVRKLSDGIDKIESNS